MTLATLLSLVIAAVIIGLIVMLAFWVIGELGVPEPFSRVARVLIVVLACVILLYYAIPLTGAAI